MAIRYCEFVPSQHRNKKPASFVFLDDPSDKHPMAICEACVPTLKRMRPDAIVVDPKKEAAQKAAAEREKRRAEKAAEEERLAEEQRQAEAASAAEEAEAAEATEDAEEGAPAEDAAPAGEPQDGAPEETRDAT